MSLIETINKYPAAIKAFAYLFQKKLIYPGSVIQGKDVEAALERRYDPKSGTFAFAYILLKNKIESEGMFITQSKQIYPGFRILSTEEMADFGHRKLMNNIMNNYKIGFVMANADISRISERDQKKHKFIGKKAGETASMSQKILMEDYYF